MMAVKKPVIIEESSTFLKVKAFVFKELQDRGYKYLVAADEIPDKVSGFKDNLDGILNIECIPYKEEPFLLFKKHQCYVLPSNKLNEMICNEVDYIIRKKYLGKSKDSAIKTAIVPMVRKKAG